MVGEIRDLETASIAVKAALTGHLVLSTLHTNDAPSAINRLIDMGIEPFLVASSVNLILAQRLVRRICNALQAADRARRRGPARAAAGSRGRGRTASSPRAKGCVDCNNTGYRGRQGVYEVMPMTPRDPGPDPGPRVGAARSRSTAIEEGMLTLRRTALEKLEARHHDRGRSPEGNGGRRRCSRPPATEETTIVVTLRQLLEEMIQKGARTCTSRRACRRSSASTASITPSEHEVADARDARRSSPTAC